VVAIQHVDGTARLPRLPVQLAQQQDRAWGAGGGQASRQRSAVAGRATDLNQL
jgi:hypothetical protein